MARFCNPLLGFFFILFLNTYAYTLPQNEIVDHGYLGIFTKSMPKKVFTFTLDMQKKLNQERPGEIVLTSPLSAYAALMMLHLGAGDETRQKLNEVLKISENDVHDGYEKIHESFGEMLKKVEHKHQEMDSGDHAPETIITNGFFVQQDRHISDSFMQSLRKYYNANVTNVDFLEHADATTDLINSWVSESTKNRINKLYDTPVPSSTVSVLASALYFRAGWVNPFDKYQTEVEKFHTGSSDVDVHMMQNQKVVLYTYSDILQFDSIELPYAGDEYAMTIQLPRPSQTLKNMTDHIHLVDIQELNRNSKIGGVDYKIPKMKFSWKNSLVNALGLEGVFNGADLSRMTSGRVPISNMLQATEIEVNEEGTVATAATAISGSKSFPRPIDVEKTFYVDRPFTVAIIHKPTQMILFYASIYNPEQ